MNPPQLRSAHTPFLCVILCSLFAATGYVADAQTCSGAAAHQIQESGMQQKPSIDLQGKYTGVVNIPSEGISGNATITIDDLNRFTLETKEGTRVGLVSATRTGNYVALALRFEDSGQATTASAETVSVRLRQQGKTIKLANVPEEDTSFTASLKCPDYPACLESDICRPFCSAGSGNRGGPQPQ